MSLKARAKFGILQSCNILRVCMTFLKSHNVPRVWITVSKHQNPVDVSFYGITWLVRELWLVNTRFLVQSFFRKFVYTTYLELYNGGVVHRDTGTFPGRPQEFVMCRPHIEI